jgi:hypothetical protein
MKKRRANPAFHLEPRHLPSPTKIVPASTRSRAEPLHGRACFCVCVFAEFYGASPRSFEAAMYKQFALFENVYFAAAELP